MYKKLKDKLIQQADSIKYIVVDEIQNCIDGRKVCYGHMCMNTLLHGSLVFRLSLENMKDLQNDIIDKNKNIKTNFRIEGDTINGHNIRKVNNVICKNDSLIVGLNSYIPQNIFHLLSILDSYDATLECGDWTFKVNQLKFAKDEYSVYLVKKDFDWYTKRFIYYNGNLCIEPFSFILNKKKDKPCLNVLKSYMSSDSDFGSISESKNQNNLQENEIRFEVDVESMPVAPLDISNIPMLFSQHLLLSALQELDFSNTYSEGVNLAMGFIKELLDCKPIYYPRIHDSNEDAWDVFNNDFKTKSIRSKFGNKDQRIGILNDDRDIRMLIGDYIQIYEEEDLQKILQIVKDYTASRHSSLALEGFEMLMRNSTSDFQFTNESAIQIKRLINERDIQANLYYYFWRSVFIEDIDLVSRLFGLETDNFNKRCRGYTLRGGVYNSRFVIN